jgi:Icc-related predicted phosphoesterase
MKIAVCSDVHLEFGDLDLHNEEGADVLILGGDILVADDLKGAGSPIVKVTETLSLRAERYVDFINRCSERFPHVIYIMGNHEHYHGDFAESDKLIKGTFGDLKNFYFLDKDWININGIFFYGGTLWTDMNKEDPITMQQMAYCMNDYRGVQNSEKQFRPDDTVVDHKEFLKGLDLALSLYPNHPFVVVGHHAPSKQSTHPRYKTEWLMNGAYSTNLDDFILDRRQIKLWTHGHTHEEFDYMIGTTRVVCNPRGYDGYEARADEFKLKYVEI